MKINNFSAVFLLFLVVTSVHAQGIRGKWKTVDDETGKTKSIVELYEQEGAIYGKITQLLLPEDQGKLCEKCSGTDHDKPMVGLVIVKGLKQDKADSNTYAGGTILDPKKGKTYTCKMWIEKDDPDKLYVRGYIAFFYRTQNWYRVKE